MKKRSVTMPKFRDARRRIASIPKEEANKLLAEEKAKRKRRTS